MNDAGTSTLVTRGERARAQLLRWLPWLAFLLCVVPLPFYFLLRSLTETAGAGEYVLFALTALALGAVVGLCAAALILLYRRRWLNQLRDRLARDGITTSELDWFMAELTAAERRTLRDLERQQPLLADAYRETLAARLTAARLVRRAQRETVAVERRLHALVTPQTAERATLAAELQADRARLADLERTAAGRHAQAQTRLQQIEAAARRSVTDSQTRMALQQLDIAAELTPLVLESARLEREARAEADAVLRRRDQPTAGPEEPH